MKPVRIELPVEFQLGSVNAYLFTEPEPVLVDAGVKSEACWAALEAGLAAQGVTVADLTRVIITHPHVDHCGLARQIVDDSGADVWISELGAPWLLDFATMWQERVDFYRDTFLPQMGLSAAHQQMVAAYFANMSEAIDSLPAERVQVFALEDVLSIGGGAWQVIHTPGHASHQTCFYQPETKQLLSADMLLHKAPTPIVERPLDEKDGRVPALPQFIASLDLVESLDLAVVYPGHGDVMTNPYEVIERQRQRIDQRKAECLALVQQGYDTVAKLLEQMYGHYPIQFRFAGLWMLVGYLDLLKSDGLVTEQLVGQVYHYHPH